MSSSATGRWTAAARAAETARPDALFHDPWGAELAGDLGRAALAASESASGGPNAFLPVRTRWFDDVVVASTAPQLVILGAGMDARAYRLSTPRIVFELDLPETFEVKEPILAKGCALADRRIVPVDIRAEWLTMLLAAGFDPTLPTLWLAEGLFFYLPSDLVQGVLEVAAQSSAEGSEFAADVFGSGVLELDGMQSYITARKQKGEPLPFSSDEPGEFFSASGWAASCFEVGSAGANFGRLAASGKPDQFKKTMRSYLVHARKN